MFNSDPSLKPEHNEAVNKKLPKAIIMMIEKNNLVMAIKTLAKDENISMEAAKERIDAYEASLKAKQQQKLTTIANKQGIPNEAISFDREQVVDDVGQDTDSGELIKSHVKTTPAEQDFTGIKHAVDNNLNNLGYKKPLIPYWAKRLLVIIVIMAGMFWILWRIFG